MKDFDGYFQAHCLYYTSVPPYLFFKILILIGKCPRKDQIFSTFYQVIFCIQQECPSQKVQSTLTC